MKALDAKRILVVGDVMLDRYVYGRVERISQEAPVPVFEEDEVEVFLGGAGNVAENIRAFGATATLAGLVGNDLDGGDLAQRVADAGMGTLRCAGDVDTTVKTRFVTHSGHQVFRRDRNMDPGLVSEDDLGALIEQITDTAASVDAIIVSDYGRGVVSEMVAEAACKDHEVPVVVDPTPAPDHPWDYLYEGATAITPNTGELRTCWAGPSDKLASALCYGKSERSAVLETRGRGGMRLHWPEWRGEVGLIGGISVPVADVTGAGDTVTAALALCLANDWDMLEAARFANAAASVVVAKPGTATCSLAEATQVYRQHYACKAAAE